MEIKFSQEELKRVLHYDPDIGDFIWKERSGPKARPGKLGELAGGIDKDGYRIIVVFNQRVKAHRLAFYYMDGYIPEYEVDHINGIRDDNRWCNLREVSRSCNARNSVLSKNNTSGVVGISFYSNRWYAYINDNKKHIRLGSFKNKDDAVRARLKAEIKYKYSNCQTTSTAYLYLKDKGLLC